MAPFRNPIKTLTAIALGTSILGGCAHLPLHPPSSDITEQNYNRHLTELEQRITAMGPAASMICTESSPSKNNCVVTARLEQTTTERSEELNAGYSSTNNSIKIDCAPQFKDCAIYLIEHEIGHALYDGFTQEEKKKISELLERRFTSVDSATYTAAHERIIRAGSDFRILYSMVKRTTMWCDSIDDLEKRWKLYESIADQLQETYTLTDLQQINASHLLPTHTYCSDLRKYEESSLRDFWSFIDSIYKGRDTPDFHLAYFDFKEPEEINITGKQAKRILDVAHGDLEERHGDDTRWKKFKEDEDLDKWLSALYAVNSILPYIGTEIIMFEYQIVHDFYGEEQFASMIDSLYDLYAGPVKMHPLRFTLTPDLLETLKGIEWKDGVKIFEPQVTRYQNDPAVQTYWNDVLGIN